MLAAGAIAADMARPVEGEPLTTTSSSLTFQEDGDGHPPLPKAFDVQGGPTAITITDDAPWLTVSPSAATAPARATAAADLTGLAPGTYSATITITPATGAAVTVPVTLHVLQPPKLWVLPGSVDVSFTIGDPPQAAGWFDVRNDGNGTFRWTASDDADWLTLSRTSGTPFAAVFASIDPTGLAAGSYVANVTITAPGVAGAPQVLPVTLTVSDPTS